MHTEPKTDPQRSARKCAKIRSQPPTGWVNCTTPFHRCTSGTLRDSAQVDTEALGCRNTHPRGEHRETGRLIQGHITLPRGRQEGAHAHICMHTDTHRDAVTYVMHMEKPYSSHSSPRPLSTLCLWSQATLSFAPLILSKLESQQAAVPRGAAKLRGHGPGGLRTHAAIHSATPQQRGHSCSKGGGGAHCSFLPLCKFSCPPVGFANRPPPSRHHRSPGSAGERGD